MEIFAVIFCLKLNLNHHQNILHIFKIIPNNSVKDYKFVASYEFC